MAISLANPLLTTTRTRDSGTRQPWKAPKVFRLWHLASLDAPTIAVVWSLAFAWTARISIQPWTVLILFCGTWTFYIGDRLLDARRAIGTNNLDRLRERHYFHWRYRRALTGVALCSAATACSLVLRLMPAVAREHNSLLGAAALLYFSGVHASARLPHFLRRIASKELLVGAIFTAGCAAPSIWRAHSPRWPMLISLLFFSALAWLNCSAIEAWESRVRVNTIALCSFLLALLGLAGSLALASSDLRISALLFAGGLSAALLGWLDWSRRSIESIALRILADAVLLTPVILVLSGALQT